MEKFITLTLLEGNSPTTFYVTKSICIPCSQIYYFEEGFSLKEYSNEDLVNLEKEDQISEEMLIALLNRDYFGTHIVLKNTNNTNNRTEFYVIEDFYFCHNEISK